MKKPYNLGIIVGRFQSFHNGHKDMLDKALELCETLGVLIGSSQESGTNKNPFTYETRESILRKVYGDRLRICPLPDIGVGNTAKWGDYVVSTVVEVFGAPPDLMISGKEERRVDWMSGEAGRSIAELYIPKTIDISASRMRRFFVENDLESWKEYTDPRLWDSFGELRRIVLAAYENEQTSSI